MAGFVYTCTRDSDVSIIHVCIQAWIEFNWGTYVHASAGSDAQSTLLTPVENRTSPSCGPRPHRTLPISTVPHLDHAILPRGRHVPSTRTRVDGDAGYGTEVGEEPNGGMGEVRRPEGDGAVLVPEVDDGVVWVLAHRVACPELRSVFDHELARGRVLVLQISWVTLRTDMRDIV